ncbi:MAG: recombination mediator RecR [Armatimonadota bacterium]|nr:recombination mediator RecR [bacterium]MCS7310108.1 recombination mediator RecR [Armatimonadota bacterium]MDW8105422.1 recombination mediator RecR [Armatimonadota bacterium]MDW8291171.1 recombination mediator RecR [Armatimonadota bacterium]
MEYAKPLAKLIRELEKMPGIGPRSAQRLAFYILRLPQEEARALSEAILEVKERITTCRRCFNFTEEELCPICRNPLRDPSLLCVVAEVRDLMAIERTQEYRGVYHVLQGVISPMDGVGVEQLRVRELLQRLQSEPIREVIIAMNPTIEGDATAHYLSKLIKPLGIRVTQLAHGVPIGGDLDYADQATLVSALEWRREL